MDAGVYFDIGGFDEEFFAYYEDVDPAGAAGSSDTTSATFRPLSATTITAARAGACRRATAGAAGAQSSAGLRQEHDDANLSRVLPLIQGLAFRRVLPIGPRTAAYRIEAPRPWRRTVPGRSSEGASGSTSSHTIPLIVWPWPTSSR